jgi:hypothetical protein
VGFSTGGVKKHHKDLSGKVHVKNLLPKRLRGGKGKRKKVLSSVVSPLRFVFKDTAFLAVSLHEELKRSFLLEPGGCVFVSY